MTRTRVLSLLTLVVLAVVVYTTGDGGLSGQQAVVAMIAGACAIVVVSLVANLVMYGDWRGKRHD